MSETGAMTDQAMIDQLAGHVAGLRRYAFALTGGQQEAEDLVQDTLLRAIAAARSFRAGGNLRAWLFSIMHNAFISGRGAGRRCWSSSTTTSRRPRRRPSCSSSRCATCWARSPGCPRPSAPRSSLIALEEFSYEEAAKVLDIPLGTLMSRLARGRETLRQMTARGRRPPLQVVGDPSVGAKR